MAPSTVARIETHTLIPASPELGWHIQSRKQLAKPMEPDGDVANVIVSMTRESTEDQASANV